MAAWLVLAQLAKTPEEAIEILNQGIARGRELHADLIASLSEEHDIWGHIETRSFMRLFYELALTHTETDNLEAAIGTYEEMIRLNPGDNQGVRGPLLHHLITLNQRSKVNALLKRYRDTVAHDTGMAYGKALSEIFRAMTALKEGQLAAFERIEPSDLKSFRKCFGPAFPPVEKAVKAAIRANPYVALLMALPGIMDLDPPEMIAVGGPGEAVEYVQNHGPLWVAIPIPFMLLGAFAVGVKSVKNPRPGELEELEDIVEAGGPPGRKPWWLEMLEEIED